MRPLARTLGVDGLSPIRGVHRQLDMRILKPLEPVWSLYLKIPIRATTQVVTREGLEAGVRILVPSATPLRCPDYLLLCPDFSLAVFEVCVQASDLDTSKVVVRIRFYSRRHARRVLFWRFVRVSLVRVEGSGFCVLPAFFRRCLQRPKSRSACHVVEHGVDVVACVPGGDHVNRKLLVHVQTHPVVGTGREVARSRLVLHQSQPPIGKLHNAVHLTSLFPDRCSSARVRVNDIHHKLLLYGHRLKLQTRPSASMAFVHCHYESYVVWMILQRG